jgi:hypothetical protein
MHEPRATLRVNTRCEAGRCHQANGDDKLTAIDTLGSHFGEGTRAGRGGKLAAIKSTRGSRTLGRRTDEDKERATGEARNDYVLADRKDYIFHPFVIVESALFLDRSRVSSATTADARKV